MVRNLDFSGVTPHSGLKMETISTKWDTVRPVEMSDPEDYPGPGSYRISGSFGPQIDGRRRNSVAPRFPPRLKDGLDEYSANHARVLSTDSSPGAGRYNIRRNLSSLSVSFAQSRRPSSVFPSRPETTPGAMSSRRLIDSREISFARSKRPNTVSSSSCFSSGTSNWDRDSWRPVSFGFRHARRGPEFSSSSFRRSRSSLTSRGVSFTKQEPRKKRYSFSEEPGPGTYYSEQRNTFGNVPILRNLFLEKPRLDFRKMSKYPTWWMS